MFQSCHSCVCKHRAQHILGCTCSGHCPCGGDCYDCQCCGCGVIHSGRLNRNVCKACNCGCGTEWNPDVPGHHRCKSSCDGGCFPGTARLTLENGKSITMSELQIGDKVQTGIVSRWANTKIFLCLDFMTNSC